MSRVLALGLVASALVAGCAGPQSAAPPPPVVSPAASVPAAPTPRATLADRQHYRCDENIEFTVRFGQDTALLDFGTRGSDLLDRDAGGLTPEQTVYSNGRLRAEFGLGASGREAILRYRQPPLVARCVMA